MQLACLVVFCLCECLIKTFSLLLSCKSLQYNLDFDLQKQASKKKDDEILRLKTSVRDMTTDHEEAIISMKTKLNQQIYALQSEVDSQKKAKARFVRK